MSKRPTQKTVMESCLWKLNRYHKWAGWHFEQIKVKGLKHVIQGDSEDDYHVTFSVPMLRIQEANMDFERAIDYMVITPINNMMRGDKK